MTKTREKDEAFHKLLVFPKGENNSQTVSDNNAHLKAIVKEVYSSDDIKLKTDLTSAQVQYNAVGLTFAKRYGVSLLEDIINEQMLLAVSKNRKGRKEFENIASSIMASHRPVEEEDSGILSRLIGKN